MKRSTTLFGAAIFCVLCFSLFLLMDAPAPSSGRISQEDSELLAKLKELETQVAAQDRMVEDVRKLLIEMGSLGQEGQQIFAVGQRVNAADNPLAQLTVAGARSVTGGVCTLAESPDKSSHADVQMMSVYNVLPFDNPDGGVWKQGFDITYSPDQWSATRPLRVFVVPHSHDDPGWIKTFERYFVDQTRAIHNNMVPKLEFDSRRKFIYAEVSFFSLWWNEQSDEMRRRVKNLLERGQFEVVTGGWVMTDEANAHYYAMIDQLIEGHEWLRHNFGNMVKLRSGWAVDPFGHSPTMAYLLKRAGFQNMLIQRVHYSIKKYMSKEKQLEFMWRQSWDATGETDIFCHMMPFYSYDVPHTCGPEPAVCCQFDFKRLPGSLITCPWRVAPVAITESNVGSRANLLLDQYRKKAQLYRSSSSANSATVMAPLGDDFRYNEASEWDAQYVNYQKLFDYMNGQENWHVQAQFGTLSDYFDAVRQDSRAAAAVAVPAESKSEGTVAGFPVLSGDFFTYADRDQHYFSGYFTSRPFYKHMSRMLESHIRAAEIVYSIARGTAATNNIEKFPAHDLMSRLVAARRNLALFQHHDGIAGTAREHVFIDYGQRLLEAWRHTMKIMESASHYLLSDGTYDADAVIFDMDEDRSAHDSLPSKKVLKVGSTPRRVVIYNSLGHKRQELVRLHVSVAHVVVKDSAGSTVAIQLSPHFAAKDTISHDIFVLDFLAEVPALGLRTYTVQALENSVPASLASVEMYNFRGEVKSFPFSVGIKHSASDDEIHISNSYTKASFSSFGLLQSIIDKGTGKATNVRLQFVKYGVINAHERSGAYIFLPDGEAEPIVESAPLIRVIRGPLLQEVHSFYKHVEHRVRLPSMPGSRGQAYEIDNIVDITSEANFEIAMRLTTSVNNNDRDFYTDLNGFQILRRRTLDKLPLQANVYPMPAAAYIEDSATRVTLLSAESHGIASLQKGWLEAFLDRRLMQDDGRGLGEPVKDNKRTRNLFLLVVEQRPNPVKTPVVADVGFLSPLAAILSLNLMHHPFIMPLSQSAALAKPVFSGVTHDLPCDLHLLNIRTQQDAGTGSGEEVFRALRSAYLILHRLAFDCSWPIRALQCTPSSHSAEGLQVSEVLPSVGVSSIQSVSLTGVHDHGVVKSFAVPAPMHISTYRIHY